MSTREHRARSGGASRHATPIGANEGQASDLNHMLEASQHLFDTWQTIGNELRQLGRRNVEQSFQTAKAMNGIADPHHAFELQMEFWRGAAENCAHAAQVCMALSVRGMSDGYACFTSTPRALFGACPGWINPVSPSASAPPRAST